LALIEEEKNWLFEKADSAVHATNFTAISDGIRKRMAPIYHRISENATIPVALTKFTETLDIVRYSMAIDWPQRLIVPSEEFINLYREAQVWFDNARRTVLARQPWEDAPVRTKDFEKRGRHLYDAWLKINGPLPQAEPPAPKEPIRPEKPL
jgi:hypothetical protein